MTVPTSSRLRSRVGLVDKIDNFGSFPPTEAYRDSKLKGQGILLKIGDARCDTPAKAAEQIIGIRSHGLFGGFWQPVPPSNDDGALRASAIDTFLDGVNRELDARRQPHVDCAGLNLEGYSITQIRDFLWGRPGMKGWRGAEGLAGSGNGLRSGFPCWWIEEPWKDGTVKPMPELMQARMMLAVEEFAGKPVDMTPIDGQRAMIDRFEGRRWDGSKVTSEAWPLDQVVACYDAGRGVEIRYGLDFTLDRAREFHII